MSTPTYLYRCTEQQLEEHLQRIAHAGDAVEHVIFKGGRDYVLVCRKSADEDPVVAALHAILDAITAVRPTFVFNEVRAPETTAAEVARLTGVVGGV